MKFVDDEHEKFYYQKLNESKASDVYYKALFYTIGIAESTREHCDEIFNLEKREINLDSLQKGWQTGTSMKVTRLALNLWNHNLMYDSEDDLENEKLSEHYGVSEIFCCSYAPFFYEAIKIRYPEYTDGHI